MKKPDPLLAAVVAYYQCVEGRIAEIDRQCWHKKTSTIDCHKLIAQRQQLDIALADLRQAFVGIVEFV